MPEGGWLARLPSSFLGPQHTTFRISSARRQCYWYVFQGERCSSAQTGNALALILCFSVVFSLRSLSLSPLPLAKAESDLDLARMLQIMLGIAIHCEKKQGKAFLAVCVCIRTCDCGPLFTHLPAASFSVCPGYKEHGRVCSDGCHGSLARGAVVASSNSSQHLRVDGVCMHVRVCVHASSLFSC